MTINITHRWGERRMTATLAVHEKYLPPGEAHQYEHVVFVATDIAAQLGEADDELTCGDRSWPAWRIEMDECCREVN